MDNPAQIPFILHPAPADRRCSAKSKRSGEQCKNWAMKGKSVCKFHGGRSTGARTAAGKEAARTARLAHGRNALEVLKNHQTDRICDAVDRLMADCLTFLDYARRQLAAMDYNTYRALRPKLAAFCAGEISLYNLIACIDNKKPIICKQGLLLLCAENQPELPIILQEEIKKFLERKHRVANL